MPLLVIITRVDCFHSNQKGNEAGGSILDTPRFNLAPYSIYSFTFSTSEERCYFPKIHSPLRATANSQREASHLYCVSMKEVKFTLQFLKLLWPNSWCLFKQISNGKSVYCTLNLISYLHIRKLSWNVRPFLIMKVSLDIATKD